MKINRNRQAFTFVEVCMSVLILSLVFGVAAFVISYARKESQKGFWIQQGITQIRNGTRHIGIKMKEMSYPSTLVKYASSNAQNQNIKIIPFKEKRTYDNSGRLRDIEEATVKCFELHAMTNQAEILPNGSPQVLMLFPICEPEKDFSDGYTAGVINWVRIVLEPSPDFDITKLGVIVMEEYEDQYDTRANPNRAFNYEKSFSTGSRLLRRKELIEDVSKAEITSYDVSTVRGIAYKKDGTVNDPVLNHKNIVTFSVWCTHPKDDKITLNDMCSVTSNTEVESL